VFRDRVGASASTLQPLVSFRLPPQAQRKLRAPPLGLNQSNQ
jgi:hypothetical protein